MISCLRHRYNRARLVSRPLSISFFILGLLFSFNANATECAALPTDGNTSLSDLGLEFTGASKDGLSIPFDAITFEDSGRQNHFFGNQSGLEESFFFAIGKPSKVTLLHIGAPTDSTGVLYEYDNTIFEIARADDSFGTDLHFRFEETLEPGIYCVETAAFNNGESKPWTGSIEITVETIGIDADTTVPACEIQGEAVVNPGATRFSHSFSSFFDEGRTVSNKIVLGDNIRLEPGVINFSETTPPLNYIVQQAGQPAQTRIPSGDFTTLSQAGEFCLYLERPTTERLETESVSGSFSYAPTNDVYLDLLAPPSGNIDVAENQGTLQLPLIVSAAQTVDTLVFVKLEVTEAQRSLDFTTDIFNTVVSIPPGADKIDLPISIINDTVIEPDEQIKISFEIPTSLEAASAEIQTNGDIDFFLFDSNYSTGQRTLSSATITIRDDDTPSQENRTPSISISAVPTGTVGQLLQFGVVGSDLDNDALSFTFVGSASTWLAINESSGFLSGTPTASGTFTDQTVTVTDTSGATASATFTLVVNPAPITITTTTTTTEDSGGSGGCSIATGSGDPLLAWLLMLGIAGVVRSRRKS